MSGDPFVSNAVVEAVNQYGQASLRRDWSVVKKTCIEIRTRHCAMDWVEDAIVLVGGHSTNETVIGHLVDTPDLILHDALSHNSIVQVRSFRRT